MEMHLNTITVIKDPLTLTTVLVVIVLMIDKLAFCRPCLRAFRTLPGEMVQSLHMLESRRFSSEIAGTLTAFECGGTVACRVKVVIASLPACTKGLAACTALKIVAHDFDLAPWL